METPGIAYSAFARLVDAALKPAKSAANDRPEGPAGRSHRPIISVTGRPPVGATCGRPTVAPTVGRPGDTSSAATPNNHTIPCTWWHDHEFLRSNPHVETHGSRPQPFVLHESPHLVHPHLAVHDLAKQTRMGPRANRHEIQPGLRVVVPAQTNRSASVPMQIRSHVDDVLSAPGSACFLWSPGAGRFSAGGGNARAGAAPWKPIPTSPYSGFQKAVHRFVLIGEGRMLIVGVSAGRHSYRV